MDRNLIRNLQFPNWQTDPVGFRKFKTDQIWQDRSFFRQPAPLLDHAVRLSPAKLKKIKKLSKIRCRHNRPHKG